jgi:hypothetical protein
MNAFKTFKKFKTFKTFAEPAFGLNDLNGALAVERFKHPSEVRSYGH